MPAKSPCANFGLAQLVLDAGSVAIGKFVVPAKCAAAGVVA